MKALSIQQPWAYLIVNGFKDIENRSWNTKFRGKFLVHAGKKFDREGLEYVQKHFGLLLNKTKKDFDLGGIVGEAEITGCFYNIFGNESKWYIPGQWGFKLTNAKSLEFKPCNGQLGFFEINVETFGN